MRTRAAELAAVRDEAPATPRDSPVADGTGRTKGRRRQVATDREVASARAVQIYGDSADVENMVKNWER